MGDRHQKRLKKIHLTVSFCRFIFDNSSDNGPVNRYPANVPDPFFVKFTGPQRRQLTLVLLTTLDSTRYYVTFTVQLFTRTMTMAATSAQVRPIGIVTWSTYLSHRPSLASRGPWAPPSVKSVIAGVHFAAQYITVQVGGQTFAVAWQRDCRQRWPLGTSWTTAMALLGLGHVTI